MVRPPLTVLTLPRLRRRNNRALFFVMLSASFPVRLRSVVVTISVRVLDGFCRAMMVLPEGYEVVAARIACRSSSRRERFWFAVVVVETVPAGDPLIDPAALRFASAFAFASAARFASASACWRLRIVERTSGFAWHAMS